MSSPVQNFYPMSLQVGQWVSFGPPSSPSYIPSNFPEAEALLRRPFKVITREDIMMDPCRCWLRDIDAKNYDYCPRMNSISLVNLPWGFSVLLHSPEESVKLDHVRITLVEKYLPKELGELVKAYEDFSSKIEIEESGELYYFLEKAYEE